MTIIITEERPDTPNAQALITELDAVLSPLYPQESRHGYSVQRLIDEGVLFYVMYDDGVPMACGGVRIYENQYAEVKRMYVRAAKRGLGLGWQMLTHLATVTQKQGISVLRLETGIHQTEAIRLYERFGFYRIEPFAPYSHDPVSLCYEKRLTP